MSLPPLPKDFDARFERAFGLVAYVANRHVLDHMRRITLELRMDLDTVFIWGTLAHLNVAPRLPPGADPSRVLTDTGMLPEGKLNTVRLADLSQITGMPRETVRRKLEKLQKQGKVQRDEDGGWVIVQSSVDASLRAFTRETTLRLLAAAGEVVSVLERAERR